MEDMEGVPSQGDRRSLSLAGSWISGLIWCNSMLWCPHAEFVFGGGVVPDSVPGPERFAWKVNQAY